MTSRKMRVEISIVSSNSRVQPSRSARNQGRDKRGEFLNIDVLLAEVFIFIKVVNLRTPERQEIFMCRLYYYVSNFCRFANGGANHIDQVLLHQWRSFRFSQCIQQQ